MLKLQNVSIGYKRDVLVGINLNVKPSTFLALLGPNGSGKTTLLYSIFGIIPDEIEGYIKGSIDVFGKKPSEFKDKFILFQDVEHELIGPTVFEDVMLNARSKEKADKAIKLMELDSIKDRDVFEISHGEKLRTLLASAISSEAKLLLLDEPTAGLDFPMAEELFKVLKRLSKDKIIIVATHDTYLAYKYAKETALIHEKRVLIGRKYLKHAKKYGLRPLRL